MPAKLSHRSLLLHALAATLVMLASVPAAAQAVGPEDVPDLTQPEPGPVVPQANRAPVMQSVEWSPRFPVVGQPAATLPDGTPVYFTVTASGWDPESQPLTYVYSTSNRVWGPTPRQSIAVTSIGGAGYATMTVVATDPGGLQSDPLTVKIPLLDPVDGRLNDLIREYVSGWQAGRLGELSALEVTDITIREDGASQAPGTSAQAVIDGPAPWQDARVQQCVQQYLQQIVLPIEDRLSPGTFTRIDEWGRLLGPSIQATGPVEGFWDGPTHFVWSQLGGSRATARYGIALRDYVADCLEGVTSAGVAPGAAGERAVADVYRDAQTAIEAGNASLRAGDVRAALQSYQSALTALRRAQQADVGGRFAADLAKAIALAERNIALSMDQALPPAAAGSAQIPPAGAAVSASLSNGDLGGGVAVPTMEPGHGGRPGEPGLRFTAEGVEFLSTEADGRSNALINWEFGQTERSRFRRTATVAFDFYARRDTHVGGELFGDNYGFDGFRNGQSTISAASSRIENGAGRGDDQVQIGLNVWHGNVWYSIEPRMTLEYDRWYRIGFAWGGPDNDYELWRDGELVSGFNLPAGVALPWGMDSPPSALNFGLGDNHQRGNDPYGSAAGVIFSDIRIWTDYRPAGDTGAAATAGSDDLPGQRWATQNELGWSGIWTRRGTSNVFDGFWTHPQWGRVTGTLTIDIDENGTVFVRRSDISADVQPAGWAPGKTCFYRGPLDAARRTVTGLTSCEWDAGPYSWSARIDGQP